MPGIPWSADLGGWVVARHADNRAGLVDVRLSAQRLDRLLLQQLPREAEARQIVSKLHERSMFFSDPPGQTEARQIVRAAFERNERQLREAMTGTIDRIAAAFVAQEGGDLLANFAVPVSIALMRRMVGGSEQELCAVRAAVDSNVGLFGYATASAAAETVDAIHTIEAFVDAIIKSEPADSPTVFESVKQRVGQNAGGRSLLTGIALDLVAGGYVPLTNLIGNTLVCLLRNADQLAQLRCRPELLTSAILEAGRFEVPNQLTSRIAKETFDWLDSRIEAGEMIFFLLASANRDEAVFERPDVYDLNRAPGRSLIFGSGAHTCVGASFAVAIAEIAIRCLLARTRRIELLGDPSWHTKTLRVRGLKRLDVSCG